MVVLFLLIIEFQGLQRVAAWTIGGFAHPTSGAAIQHAALQQFPAGVTRPAPIKVITYNVFMGSALAESFANGLRAGPHEGFQGFKPWSQRYPSIGQRIATYEPDLIGLQELGSHSDITSVVPTNAGYTLVSYKLGGCEYNDAAILYRSSRFEKLDSGQWWLTPTPDLPLSFGAKFLSLSRYVNWVLLRERPSGLEFLFVNTHFDNAKRNKLLSARLFRQRISTLATKLPIIVTGDFNSRGETDVYRTLSATDQNPPLLRETQCLARKPWVLESLVGDRRILGLDEPHCSYLKSGDHIMVGGPLPISVPDWVIDERPMQNGQKVSDHALIAATIEFALTFNSASNANDTPMRAISVQATSESRKIPAKEQEAEHCPVTQTNLLFHRWGRR